MSLRRLCLAVVAAMCVSAGAVGPAVADHDPSATLVYEGDALTLAPETNQTVTGETTLDAGETLQIRIRSSGDPERPFLKSQQVTVSEFGQFSASFDFSEIPAGTEFVVTGVTDSQHDDTTVTLFEERGRVVATDGTEATGSPNSATRTDRPPLDERDFTSIAPVHRGSTVELVFPVEDGDTAHLRIGGEEAGYSLNATLRDTDGDGRVAVEFDSANAGFGAPTLRSLGADEVTDVRESSLADNGLLDPGQYDIAVAPSARADASFVGTLVVEEAQPSDPTTADPPATTTDEPSTTATDESPTTASVASPTTVPTDSGPFGDQLGGVGALALGGLFAVVGVAVLLGSFRS